MTNSYHCSLCNSALSKVFSATVLQRYHVAYYQCATCGILQSEEPYWLDEAYQNAVVSSDTGLVARNVASARTLSVLLYYLFDSTGAYLDVAGGYGLLTRLMRDYGYEFLWSDEYCANILAPGFSLSSDQEQFDAITAFEVIEHLHDPLAFLQHWLAKARTNTVIFTTQLYRGAPPPLDWWYYGFENGQHVSFFQRRTLDYMASKLGVRCLSHGVWHMFTDRSFSPVTFSFLTSKIARPLSIYVKRRLPSKTFSDSQLIISRLKLIGDKESDGQNENIQERENNGR